MPILYIILGLIVVFVCFSLFTRRYINPYKLYLIFGKKGSGKSTMLVKLAKRYSKKGWYIYTNMADMMIGGVRWIDVQQLGEFVPCQNSILLIDEVGTIWDNRNFKNFKSETRDFFKYQRHYRCIVYLASQTFDIDKKIRDLTDGMYLHINVANILSVGKLIYKKIVLTDSTSEAESRIAENLKFAPFWRWKLTYIPKWAKLFDSFNIPDRPELPYKELMEREPSKQLKKLKCNQIDQESK